MGGLFASIGYNLGNLARISGRDTRAQFWPYAIFLFILAMIVGLIIFAVAMAGFFMRMQQYMIEHPEGPPIDDKDPYAQPVFPPELVPDFGGIMLPMVAVNILFALLLAAAVARRLHDRDMTGLWGLMPLPFWAIGALAGPRLFTAFDPAAPPDPSLVMLIMLSNLVSFAAFIALIVLLAAEGSRGPNRYGPEPIATR